MRKFFNAVYFVVMAAVILSLSGCGGSSHSDSYSGSGSGTPAVKQVAVLDSPALQKNGSYEIYKGAVLDMDEKYFVADVGGKDNQAVMNLGLSEALKNTETFAVTDKSTGKVIFAYNPGGNGSKTSGEVKLTGGTRLKYNSLSTPKLSAGSLNMFSALAVDMSNVTVIQLNGSKASIGGEDVKEYPYVWNIDPDTPYEYWTEYPDGTEKLKKKKITAKVSGDAVYIMRDVRYTPDTLAFDVNKKASKTEDNGMSEEEYVVYYNSEAEAVKAEIADIVEEKGASFDNMYILATLPKEEGAGGNNGLPNEGNRDGGETPPEKPDGDDGSGNTPPAKPGDSGRNGGRGNANIRPSETTIAALSTMTHSAELAYKNPVLHINKPGTYVLQGKWHGQIWIDAVDWTKDANDDDYDVEDDPDAKVSIILNNVEVSCDVAPALVFHDLRECGPDDEDTVAASYKTLGTELIDNAAAMVLISDDTVNYFTGANVYRILKLEPKKSASEVTGKEISYQKKLYKMDGAFYSFVSMAIGGGSKANGVLNITSSTYEGLDAELHMTIENGIINVTAEDDGINVNEDNLSVFTMMDGSLTVTGKNGDGIDSNGYIVILDADKLDVTAKQDSNQDNAGADGPLDADKEVYISDSARANYTHQAYSGNSNPQNPDGTREDPNGSDDTKEGGQETDSETNTESNAEVSETITTNNGTTTITISSTSSSAPTLRQDTEGERDIPESDTTFRLVHEVNDFSAITAE